jgi:hypothetical protein
MQSCILTATMGNYIRARHFWLRDRVVYSETLWPDPVTAGVEPVGFTRPEFFEESSMLRLRDGSLVVMITTDEDNPSKVVAKRMLSARLHEIILFCWYLQLWPASSA